MDAGESGNAVGNNAMFLPVSRFPRGRDLNATLVSNYGDAPYLSAPVIDMECFLAPFKGAIIQKVQL